MLLKKVEYMSMMNMIVQMTTRGIVLSMSKKEISIMYDIAKEFVAYRSCIEHLKTYPKMTLEEIRLSERDHLWHSVEELKARRHDIAEECKLVGITGNFFDFNSEMVREHNKLAVFYYDKVDISELIDFKHGK